MKMYKSLIYASMMLMTGCSTLIFNATSSSNVYYSGTKVDAKIIASPFYCLETNDICGLVKNWPVIWPLAIIDLPLCAVVDTIYFPFQRHRMNENR